MAITKVAELGDTVPVIIEKAQLVSQFAAIMAGLVWNKDKRNRAGSTVNIPYFHEVAATVLTEGIDMTSSETMEDTNVPITLYEVGAKIILTDNAIEDDQEEVRSVAGRILGQAMEKKRDQDLLAELDDANTTLCGSANSLTMGHIAAAKAILAGNDSIAPNRGPAPLPYVCVLHPFQTLDLVDVLTPVAGSASYATSFSDDIIKNYTIGRLFSMNVIEDGNMQYEVSGAATSGMKGGVFAQGEGGAIVLATARDWDIRPERDESLRGWELNCVGRYGVGEYNKYWIVELFTDAAVPA